MLLSIFIGIPVISSLPNNTSVAQAATITISSKAATLEIGKTKSLKISGTRNKVSWSSGKKSIATVSSSGTVTAKAVGTTTITASVSGKKLTCKIVVVKPPIKISKTSITLEEGQTHKLSISGTTKTVTWSSSNKSIATVSSKGTITAKTKGSVTITASVNGKKYTCKVTVIKPILISDTLLFLEVGETKKLSISGTTKTITWTSSDKSVATVSSKGTITAKAAGTTTITASVAGKKLTCKVTVEAPVTLSTTSVSMLTGTSVKLKLSSNANTSIWTSNQKNIATVTNDGTVTAYRAGEAIITAYIDGKRLRCKVNVTNPDDITEPGISLNLGDQPVAITARGITEGVIFASSNSEVATISSDGYITPVSLGQTRITATNGDEEYTYLVTIIDSTINPYMANAPFIPKKVSFDKLSFIAPKDWILETEDYEETISSIMMLPSNTSESSAFITIFKTDETVKYLDIKNEYLKSLTKEYVLEQFEYLKEWGISYKLSGFTQSDYGTDFGRAFKTEYTVLIDNERAKQSIYVFSIDEYVIQVTVTDPADYKNLNTYIKYIINSFQMN